MNKLDNNFEKLKQSMLEKRLKAEAVNKSDRKTVDKNDDVNVDVNVDVNTNKNADTNVGENVNRNIYTNVDENVYTSVDNSTNNSDYKDVNKTVNNSVNSNVNKFVIKANECDETLVRYTLYLKPDTINKIGHYSKLLNLGKSELARKILEETLANLEIV